MFTPERQLEPGRWCVRAAGRAWSEAREFHLQPGLTKILVQDATRIWTVQQNMTKTMGRHEFEFDGQVRANQPDLLPEEQYTRGLFQFNSMATSLYDPQVRIQICGGGSHGPQRREFLPRHSRTRPRERPARGFISPARSTPATSRTMSSSPRG